MAQTRIGLRQTRDPQFGLSFFRVGTVKTGRRMAAPLGYALQRSFTHTSFSLRGMRFPLHRWR